MKKIPPWLWVTGAVVGIWYFSKPKAGGATIGATGAAPAGSLDAGRVPHGGGHHHFHGGPRGFVGHSVDYVDYGAPVMLECDPRLSCAQQPILPCRCG